MKALFLKVLILGGTNFLGPHLVEELQQRGHEITLFNRGNQDVSHLRKVEHLRGDREGNLQALEGRSWDAVIDTSGNIPRIVEASSQLLAHATNHYTFVSTVGVYANFHQQNIDESYPVAQLDNPENEEITEKSYGALKAGCEQVVEHYFPGKTCIVRPGLIVGPGDPTGRFSYWPFRIREGGAVLAPGNPQENVQFIDVRDLAKWIVDGLESQTTGIFNATGRSITFETLLTECQNATQTEVHIHWVEEPFLVKQGVQDWVELPLWLSSGRNMPGFLNVSVEKACSMGLSFRPLKETLTAILEQKNAAQGGMTRAREQELLELWKERKAT